jgi:hypothetical protein
MATPAESSQPKSPEGDNAPAYHPDLDEQLHGAWQKYGKTIAYAAVLVLAFYVIRGGIEFFHGQHEADVEQEFAAAKTPDQLKAFVGSHPDHKLAAVAEIQIADDSYASGQLASAIVAYRQAIPMLKGDPLQSRAEIGLAMSQAQSGNAAEGEAGLRKVLEDGGQLPVIRAEAGYQLEALLAADGKSSQELIGVATQLQQIDPSSPWTQRAFSLAMTTKAKAPATIPSLLAAPAGGSFKAPGK